MICERSVIVVGLTVLLGGRAGADYAADREIFRAAYCLGALQSANKELVDEQAGMVASCAEQVKTPTFSAAECLTETNRVFGIQLQNNETRWSRFRNYIYLSTGQAGSDRQRQVVFATVQGQRDGADVETGRRPYPAACVQRCPSGYLTHPDVLENCALPCLDQFDQTFANVLRCTSTPDNLPF